MGCCGSCVDHTCGVCKTVRIIVLLLLTATTIVAGIGVYRDVMTAAGWVFGTTDVSFALLVFIASLAVWHKFYRKVCPCGYAKMGEGACQGCGSNPCKCK